MRLALAGLVLTAAVSVPHDAWAQETTLSKSDQLFTLLGLGDADGCKALLDVTVPDPQGNVSFPVDAALTTLGTQIGNELRGICASSAVSSASALGGAMNSLQPTKTAAQFRLVRRRIDARLQTQRPPVTTKPGTARPPARELIFSLLQQTTTADLTPTGGITGLGVFGDVEFSQRDRVNTEYETGFESTVTGFSGGVDYARGRALIGGWVERSRVDADLLNASLLFGRPTPSGVAAGNDPDFTDLIGNIDILDSVCGGAARSPGGFEQEGKRGGVFAGFGGARGPFVDGAITWGRRSHDYTVGTCAIENEGNASFAANVRFNDLNGNAFVNDGEVMSAPGRGVFFNDSDNSGTLTVGDTVFDSVFAGRISGETDIHEVSMSVRAGANIGGDAWLVSPRAVFTYTRTETDAYVETAESTVDLRVNSNTPGVFALRTLGGPTGLELAYDEQSRRSRLLEAGTEVSYRIAFPFGAILPHVFGSYRYEFDDDLQIVTVRMAQDLRAVPKVFSFATDGPDPTSLVFGAGASALVGEHFAARLDISKLANDRLYDSTTVSVLARWRF